MKNTTITRQIVAVVRAKTSAMGNPAYQLVTDNDEVFATAANVGWAYGIDNSPERGGIPRNVPLRLTLNGWGKVSRWERAE